VVVVCGQGAWGHGRLERRLVRGGGSVGPGRICKTLQSDRAWLAVWSVRATFPCKTLISGSVSGRFGAFCRSVGGCLAGRGAANVREAGIQPRPADHEVKKHR
jgi:hypothetical protein